LRCERTCQSEALEDDISKFNTILENIQGQI
jgi:hypothetical protein